MASEDWFLRLDPYNFDTQEAFDKFYSESGEIVIDKKIIDKTKEQ